MATHLIIGVSGQDGAYLAAALVGAGESVLGTSRSHDCERLPNLVALEIASQVQVVTCDPSDAERLGELMERYDVHRVYLLAGQSSVGLSFARPVETHRGIVGPAVTLLELLRTRFKGVRLLYAGSGEVFDRSDGMPFTEMSKHSPKSPYAAAKSAAMCLADTYRSAYGVFAASAILFNHESPLRPATFVVPKVVAAAARIAHGSSETLDLGAIDVFRDWGWAPDYVRAMRSIIENDSPDDFIIASGESHSIREVIDCAGWHFGVDLMPRYRQQPGLIRPFDSPVVTADPSKARTVLGWQATVRFPEVIQRLCLAAGAPDRHDV
jgi:GDPmannose 4,6-dehydratase